jgi:hypothetical protein
MFKYIMEVVFCEDVQYPLILPDHLSCIEMAVSSIGETGKLRCAKTGEQAE